MLIFNVSYFCPGGVRTLHEIINSFNEMVILLYARLLTRSSETLLCIKRVYFIFKTLSIPSRVIPSQNLRATINQYGYIEGFGVIFKSRLQLCLCNILASNKYNPVFVQKQFKVFDIQ